jgi:hypothetical protein
MSLEHTLQELEQYHKKLDENIKRGYTNYLDDQELAKIKHEKLLIKRKIINLEKKLKEVR